MGEKTIAPIQTYYNGYKTRSRLEARWLYFFDLMGLKYQYEPEGIEDKTGLRYLPDVYLPTLNCYVEIKSAHIKDTPEGKAAEQKLSTFFGDFDQPIGLILYGDPYEYEARCRCVTESSSGDCVGSEWVSVNFGLSFYGFGLILACFPLENAPREFGFPKYRNFPTDAEGCPAPISESPIIHLFSRSSVYDEDEFLKFEEIPVLLGDYYFEHLGHYIDEAQQKARQARFEYGENPDKTVEADYKAFSHYYKQFCSEHIQKLIKYFLWDTYYYENIMPDEVKNDVENAWVHKKYQTSQGKLKILTPIFKELYLNE